MKNQKLEFSSDKGQFSTKEEKDSYYINSLNYHYEKMNKGQFKLSKKKKVLHIKDV